MISQAIAQFFTLYGRELILKLEEHLYLVGFSVAAAILIGIPLGVIISRYRALKTPVLTTISLLWTIPSLALLAFLIPFLGIGAKPALLVLTLYALLPIIRNTYTGIAEVPNASLEAACGLGFTPWQRMWIVELPLAVPMIIAGVRTATAIGVGIATLAAFIGAGGLGDFINRGLATNNTTLIMLGALPAALLALLLDLIISRIEHHLATRKQQRTKHIVLKSMGAGFLIGLLALFFYGMEKQWYFGHKTYTGEIRIATKNFTEQFILGELMAQLIENKTDLKVVRKFNLGTTAIVHQALVNKEVDLYPEYTGTAYLLVLKWPFQRMDADTMYRQVKQYYQQHLQLLWLAPFGFSNSQTLAVKKEFAMANNIHTISDLTKVSQPLIIGAPAEFIIRSDAMPGLLKTYDLQFSAIKSLNPGLVYKAILNNDVNVIMAFATDGRLAAYQLKMLEDDKHFFPPYYAAPVIRSEVIKHYPKLRHILGLLAGILNDKTMQELNYAVDVGKKTSFEVAQQFLQEKGLLK